MSTPEKRGLLKYGSPMTTPSTATSTPTQAFSTRYRPGYVKVPSVSFNDEALARDITEASGTAGPAPSPTEAGSERSHGLGIAFSPSTPLHIPRRGSPLSREEHGSTSRSTASETRSMASPPSTSGLSGSTKAGASSEEVDSQYKGAKQMSSRSSLQSTLPPSICARSDTGLLFVRSKYEDFEPHHNCQSSGKVKHHRLGNWVSRWICIFTLFSMLCSTGFLIIALIRPGYGRAIRSKGGAMTPANAAFLTSLFARLIEMSFVTAFVAFLGQVLARRAFKLERFKGMTLAELTMRNWVTQPGTFFTQWEGVRYAGLTRLGIFSLAAAVFALLYTTAATALVQPQLKFPDWKAQEIQGTVKMKFANSVIVQENCKTPMGLIYQGDVDAGATCLSMEHVAMAYHNYFTWLQIWTKTLGVGNSSNLLEYRPPGYALYTDNTTVSAPWIERRDVTAVNDTRWVNNVTMAMPHVGVIQAARDPINRLPQPEDVQGAELEIRASVPSPMINVLCVTMTNFDLKPFVYDLWDNVPKLNVSNKQWNKDLVYPNDTFTYPYLGGTQFDEVFGWGPDKGYLKVPPVFPMLPNDYNMILNTTGDMLWGRTAIYVLGKGGPTDSQGARMTKSDGSAINYALCQIQAGLTPHCSTSYNSSSNGGSLAAHCEDENDEMRYSIRASEEDAVEGNATLSPEWPNIGSEWAKSLAYNDGIRDGDSANARTLTQLILTSANLSLGIPSLAEAIAVQAGETLLQSIKDAPFVGRPWNYTLPKADNQPQWFNATMRGQQYASGPSQPYQYAFYVVLIGVCLMNHFMFWYFVLHKDWYSDLSEPNHLFSLAMNSPPTHLVSGSCGGGPSGEHYAVNWKLNSDDGHYYLEPQEQPQSIDDSRLSRRWTETFEMMGSPATSLKKRFSRA